MAAMHRELVVSVADLRYVCLRCKQCNTTVTFDLQEPSQFTQKHGVLAPKDCPVCRTEYDVALRQGIDGFYRAFKPMLDVADWITFRGKVEES